ncbi:ATP-binding cassette domain-containing protein, partial [Rhizobium leguminosarum]|uniref:ATP-binding cassette domain-containing protein n=1 Tax=Rhizobium leguminosarum TaxID=384 RepID=UPI003F9E1FC5
MNSFVSTTAIEAEPQTATEEVVRLTGVKRRFGTTAALDGISLTVKRGEILGIIGRSGACKSTLIRCLNGLERADSGEILIEG